MEHAVNIQQSSNYRRSRKLLYKIEVTDLLQAEEYLPSSSYLATGWVLEDTLVQWQWQSTIDRNILG